MKFFFDNNLPPAFARAMHALSERDGHESRHLRDKFAANTADADWIEVLSDEGGWSVVTHDKLDKGLEREALRHAGLIVFFLDKGWANHAYWEKACNLVRWWPRIIEQSEGVKGAAAFKVPFNFSGKGQFAQLIL